jgi:hypothetical protein
MAELLCAKVKLSRYVIQAPWGRHTRTHHSFMTSALGRVSGQRRALPRFVPGESTPGTQCIGGCVGRRSGLNTEAGGKILCFRGSNPGHLVCSVLIF